MVSTRAGHSDPTTSKHRATELQRKVTSTNATNNPWDVLYDIGYDYSYLGLFGSIWWFLKHGGTPNHPSHRWPWLSIETCGDDWGSPNGCSQWIERSPAWGFPYIRQTQITMIKIIKLSFNCCFLSSTVQLIGADHRTFLAPCKACDWTTLAGESFQDAWTDPSSRIPLGSACQTECLVCWWRTW